MSAVIEIPESFISERGWKYKSMPRKKREIALQVAYSRLLKCKNNELLTQEEFLAEREISPNDLNVQAYKAIYASLTALVAHKRLRPADVYRYAQYRWLDSAADILAYETEQGWMVNNCPTKVSESEAIIKVNGEWGFEASRIKIIGFAYYDATDYQFIRFDCAHMTWLWQNSNLYKCFA